MNWKTVFGMCCLITILLAGCDTSSGPSGSSGVFADALVVGVNYVCGTATQTLVTGTGGTFTCQRGTTITFKVGGTTVCSAPAQPFMTLLSCAQATDPKANASTASVVAEAQFLMSINTTPTPSQDSPTAITITAAELTAAGGLSLNFATATQADLLAAVKTVTGNPAATLVTPAAAQAEITGTVLGALVGTFSGTFSGTVSGTWTATIAADGSVKGTATDSKNNTVPVGGNLVTGTVYSGTAGGAAWTGNLDTSQTPPVLSGTWADVSSGDSGSFTGTKK
jgi:hypothetical protein